MSEAVQQEATTTQHTDTTTEQAAQSVETTTQPEQASTEAAPAEKFEVPKKFLKADGTPDYERLAKSYVGLEKKLSSKGNIPAASVDELTFEFSPDVEVDDAASTAFKTEALEKGFTTEQYKFIMDKYQQIVTQGALTAEKTEAQLKSEWGKDYETHLKSANRAFDEFAPSDASPNDPIWNHPSVMKLLARMGSELGEDSVSTKTAVGTGESIDEQIKALRADPDYWSNPAKQARMEELYAKRK